MAISIFLLPVSSSTPNPNPKKPNKRSRRPISPPISISTAPSHLNPHHLQRLLFSSNLSCHRFPALSADGRPEPVDLAKLRTAVAHSFVVVSVFCRQRFLKQIAVGDDSFSGFGFESLFEKIVAAPESDHRLVGFGRAVSDGGLTASIHDVVVMPSMRRLGIGQKIVGRIIRTSERRGEFSVEADMKKEPEREEARKINTPINQALTSQGIYDISALCSEKERLFFEACGFGEDSLGSTTMIYTRTAPCFSQDDPSFRPAGRMMLLIPPFRELFQPKNIAVQPGNSVKIRTEIL